MKRYKNVNELINTLIKTANDDTLAARSLLKAKGHKDFVAKAYRQKALFCINLLKELEIIGHTTYQSMVENLDRDFKKAKEIHEKEQRETQREKESLDFEMLEYGDSVELENGDICIYVRRELDTSGGIMTLELVLINIFTGEEHNINFYEEDLTHYVDSELSIKKFAN